MDELTINQDETNDATSFAERGSPESAETAHWFHGSVKPSFDISSDRG
jgi:hypothetical protein